MYDAIIIGAGVIGGNIARELSKYKLNVCMLEKELNFGYRETGPLVLAFLGEEKENLEVLYGN